MKLSEAVVQYLTVWGLNKAETTRRRVTYQLDAFVTFMKRNGIDNVYCINISVLILWVKHLSSKGCTPLTLYCTVQGVKKLFVWLYDEEHIYANPFPDTFFSKKPEVPLRRVPTVTETFDSLVSAESSHYFPNRNRAILELAYSTGIRRGEIHRLNRGDLSFAQMHVIGKGGKERIVPVGYEAAKWIDLYIKTERHSIIEKSGSIESALFLSREGRRVSLQTLHAIATVQTKQEYALHSFRHACATHMLKNGASSRVLQKLLGHERLSTTQIYTSVDVSDLHQMLTRYHPRSKLVCE